jgi:hypothetical protein
MHKNYKGIADLWTLGKILFFIYSYVHTTFGPFHPPYPPPALSLSLHSLPLPPTTPSLPGRNCFALISNFVEEKV